MVKHTLITIIALVLVWGVPIACFGQHFTAKRPDVGKRVNIISDGNGNFVVTEAPPIISHHPIKPYGMNLQPAKKYAKKRSVAPPVGFSHSGGFSNGGPLVIDNPYYVEPEPVPAPEANVFTSIGQRIVWIIKWLFRIP